MSADIPASEDDELCALAERLFEESEEDEARLAALLDNLDPGIRSQLIVSDLLNAYQVFFYYFRVVPDEIEMERMMLEPASSLVYGIFLQERDLYEILFLIRNDEAIIVITDGERPLSVFKGRDAYKAALDSIEGLS